MEATAGRSRRLTVLALGLAVTLATLLICVPGAAGKANRPAAGDLYLLSAESGQLDRVGARKHVFELLLHDLSGDVTVFADRPARRASHQKLKSFVRDWNRLGFREDPPNAALVIAAAPSSRDVLVVELSKPRLRGDGIAFSADVVKGSATDALRRFRKRADRRVAAQFGEASLFIDPSGQPVQLGFAVSNIPPAQVFTVLFDNALLAQGDFPTAVNATGPANSSFLANAIVFGPSGSTAVSASLATGAELTTSGDRVTGKVVVLPAGSSATIQVSTESNTGPVVPLTQGNFSAPIP